MSDSRPDSKTGGNPVETVSPNPSAPGAFSLAEISSQAKCWETCLAEFSQSPTLKEIETRFGQAQDWLFIGCGSSYYVAIAAAASMKSLTGRRAWAVPASEILLYPELVFGSGACVPVLISRSGQTSEVLKAAEVLNERGIRNLAISCAPGQALEKLATCTITLPADERSTVMTRSFTSMLLALQLLAGRIGGNRACCDALLAMPQAAAPRLSLLHNQIREFVSSHAFTNYVCLGHGPFYGLACEYGLKLTEMSLSTTQVFHSLEFRHGPKSAVTRETLLIFLLSEHGFEAECDLLEEMKSLGGKTLVVANQANDRVRRAADLLVEMRLPHIELARLGPTLVPGQLLALHTGLKKDLNPDTPRYLTRSVILSEDGSPKPEPVA
ncbi:MAG TPA: SIS domain-containing protein [Terriglobales bacterium]|nr:SIS domain-containing protein [Terriglobales bacterium]